MGERPRWEAAERILVCLGYGIGDLILGLPLVERLRAAASAARITALGAAPATQLLAEDPRLDEVRDVQELGLHHWGDTGSAAARRAVRRWLEELRPQVIVDARQAPPGVRDAVAERGDLVQVEQDVGVQRWVLERGGDALHAMTAAVERGWGLPGPFPGQPRLRVTGWAARRAAELLAPLAGRAPVAMAVVASLDLKRWPAERLAWTIERVGERSLPVVVVAGPERSAALDVLRRVRAARDVVLVGREHLLVVAALLARCRLVVANDTGVLHVASAVGTPVVGVYGPTNPQVYLPRGQGNQALGGHAACPHFPRGRLGIPGCWEAGRCLVGLRSCVDLVGAKEVVAAVERAVARREAA